MWVVTVLITTLTFGGVVVRLVSALKAAGAPGTLTVRSIREPREILSAAVHFFGNEGWALTAQSAGAESFSYEVRPSRPVAVILLLLGIIPGLVYLIAGRRTLTVTVSSEWDSDRSATLVSWSHSGECEQICRDFAWMVRSQEPEASEVEPRRRTTRRRRRPSSGVQGPAIRRE